MSGPSGKHVFHLFFFLLLVALMPLRLPAQVASDFALPRWTAESVASSALPEDGTASAERRSPCASATISQLRSDADRYGRGLRQLPRNMVSRDNLKWEIPVAIAAVVLIKGVDSHVSDAVKSGSYNTASDNASNILLGTGIGLVTLDYAYGCLGKKEHARRAGFAALEAGAYGIASDLVLKAAFNREYPDKWNGDGRFWHGGKSFPSGHAATSWAVASAIAHSYPHNRWVKWVAYGGATGVSVLRLTAHKHFPSDIVIGGTLGYVTGSYIGSR